MARSKKTYPKSKIGIGNHTIGQRESTHVGGGGGYMDVPPNVGEGGTFAATIEGAMACI
jgi:hypothetical protein